MTMTKLLPRRGLDDSHGTPGEARREAAASAAAPPGVPPPAPLPAPPKHKRKHSDCLDLCAADLGLAAPAAPPSVAPGTAAEGGEDGDGARRHWTATLCSPWRLATLALLLVAAAALRTLRPGAGDDGAPAAVASRIIGGRAVAAGEHSYMVSLVDSEGRHFCGGTLVSKDVVLTAAHCTSEATGRYNLSAVVGRQRLSDAREGEPLRVVDQRAHPRYDYGRSGTQRSDFALMFLKSPTVTTAKVVVLNREATVPPAGRLVEVAGWGDTDPNEYVRDPADTLQVASLRLVSNAQCDNSTGLYQTYALSYRGYILDDMMCARHRKRDSCQGDSGGPLLYRGKQVGITSWGVGCNNAAFPGVYARVSSAYAWIQENVCTLSIYPDQQFRCEPW